MPKTRNLTLTATPEIIALAKIQARNEGTSVSAMFADFVMEKEYRSRQRDTRSHRIGPLTRSLAGIVRLPPDFDEKEFTARVLTEKHELKKAETDP